jgi:hypothetical protein
MIGQPQQQTHLEGAGRGGEGGGWQAGRQTDFRIGFGD